MIVHQELIIIKYKLTMLSSIFWSMHQVIFISGWISRNINNTNISIDNVNTSIDTTPTMPVTLQHSWKQNKYILERFVMCILICLWIYCFYYIILIWHRFNKILKWDHEIRISSKLSDVFRMFVLLTIFMTYSNEDYFHDISLVFFWMF